VIPIKVPTPVLLRAAPHLAALAILDAALVAAEEVLLANYPALHDIDAVLNGGRAPPQGSLIPILVAHFDELRDLLRRYQLAVQADLLAPDDDFPF
jgi:hypothetical protein